MSANMLRSLYVSDVSELETKEPVRHIREGAGTPVYSQEIIAHSSDGREVRFCFDFDEETNKKLEAAFQAGQAAMGNPDSTLQRVTP